jgi:hypothetical protein
MEPGAWSYNSATLSLGNRDLVLQVGLLGARLTTLLCKKKALVLNPKKWKPYKIWQNLLRKTAAQKMAVLPMMMMMQK